MTQDERRQLKMLRKLEHHIGQGKAFAKWVGNEKGAKHFMRAERIGRKIERLKAKGKWSVV